MWGTAQRQGGLDQAEDEEEEGEEEDEEEWEKCQQNGEGYASNGREDGGLGGVDGPRPKRQSTQAEEKPPGFARAAQPKAVGLDWFTVDLQEELSAFDSRILEEQALFVARAVDTVSECGSGEECSVPSRTFLLLSGPVVLRTLFMLPFPYARS